MTAAELLSIAAFDDGRHAQAFPTFGSERTGAPVVAFCRIDGRTIRTREPIAAPDLLVVLDPTLLHSSATFAGVQESATVLVNGDGEAAGLPYPRLVTVPATELARRHTGRPVPNAAMLGAVAATGAVSFDAVARAVRGRFAGAIGDANVAAAGAAYEVVAAAGIGVG